MKKAPLSDIHFLSRRFLVPLGQPCVFDCTTCVPL